jgi:hypothetical protein
MGGQPMNREYWEQKAVAEYLSVRYPNILWTASAGGMRTSIGAAIKMKATGYKRGCPDLMIFEPIETKDEKYNGLFIEMKAPKDSKGKKGVLSGYQKKWLADLEARNYYGAVCYGSKEAIELIDWYLQLGGLSMESGEEFIE